MLAPPIGGAGISLSKTEVDIKIINFKYFRLNPNLI